MSERGVRWSSLCFCNKYDLDYGHDLGDSGQDLEDTILSIPFEKSVNTPNLSF